MAATAPAPGPVNKTPGGERIVDFSPKAVRAPFELRCAALIVDYLLLIALPVGALLMSRFFNDTGAPGGIGSTVWFLGAILFLCNFLLLPLVRGQTLGKMLMGLTIVRIDGSSVDLASILRRHLLGYALTALTLGFGFLISAMNTTGRSLHDLVAGTVVIRGRKTRV
jgi:uncharacterized RDD family membrane protein YckC